MLFSTIAHDLAHRVYHRTHEVIRRFWMAMDRRHCLGVSRLEKSHSLIQSFIFSNHFALVWVVILSMGIRREYTLDRMPGPSFTSCGNRVASLPTNRFFCEVGGNGEPRQTPREHLKVWADSNSSSGMDQGSWSCEEQHFSLQQHSANSVICTSEYYALTTKLKLVHHRCTLFDSSHIFIILGQVQYFTGEIFGIDLVCQGLGQLEILH